ncbi:MAG: hypothetical protein ABFD50_16895 [Smithella sp.]
MVKNIKKRTFNPLHFLNLRLTSSLINTYSFLIKNYLVCCGAAGAGAASSAFFSSFFTFFAFFLTSAFSIFTGWSAAGAAGSSAVIAEVLNAKTNATTLWQFRNFIEHNKNQAFF